MRRIAIAVALILMLATTAYAGEIFRYVTTDGTVSFTDEMKRVPPMYKDTAEKVILEGEFKDTVTFDKSDVKLFPDVVASKVLNRSDFDRAPVCTGHISVTRERVQFDDFNRTVYFVYDECGRLVSTTFSQPEVKIER